MAIFLVIRSGEQAGTSCKVRPGLTLGRAKSGFVLKDATVSSRHAEIVKDDKNRLFIKDLKSSNGLKFAGKKVASIELKAGLRFQIGGVEVEVEGDSEVIAKPLERDKDSWNYKLASFLTERATVIASTPSLPLPFREPLSLEFIAGYQLGLKWFLGFGPRRFGRISGEFPITDLQAPEQGFIIFSEADGLPRIKSLSANVLLNGQAVKIEELQAEDIIEVGNSKIKVSFK